jgi:single-strand DNA-binding protein
LIGMNDVKLMGNLTKDPEVRFLPNTDPPTAVASLSLAVNRKWKSNGETKEEVSFFDIEAFGKTGENCGEYLHKGSPVLVEGRLKQDRWQDDQGNNRSKVKVIAEMVYFLGKKDDDQNGNGTAKQDAPAGSAPKGAAPAPSPGDAF